MIMNQLNPVTAIAWSPTRSGLLATIGKESPIVQLYDIQHASVGKMADILEFSPFVVKCGKLCTIMCSITMYHFHSLKFIRLRRVVFSSQLLRE